MTIKYMPSSGTGGLGASAFFALKFTNNKGIVIKNLGAVVTGNNTSNVTAQINIIDSSGVNKFSGSFSVPINSTQALKTVAVPSVYLAPGTYFLTLKALSDYFWCESYGISTESQTTTDGVTFDYEGATTPDANGKPTSYPNPFNARFYVDYIVNNPPTITLSSPSGGQLFNKGSDINFQWSGSDVDSDALSYTLQVGTTSGASNIYNTTVGSASSKNGISTGWGLGTYYWRVIASDSKGANITSTERTFVINNTLPTLTLTNPANNLVLSEGSGSNSYVIAGSATDTDNNNVVTIKYKINNGTTYNAGSGVSDGSTPISFSKTLIFSNKRLRDGSTDVTGVDLAENTTHTLTVWAEDNNGGVSSLVTRSFTVVWNRPPVISGSDTNLGTISAPPSQNYSVTDPEGNTITITEYLDDVVLRTFTATPGQTYTITLTTAQWLQTSLASHTLKVRATDSVGMYADRTFTFTRTEDKILFTLDYSKQAIIDFFTTDVKANRILVTLDAVIPDGAVPLIEACNNAYDASPTWEDVTSQALAGRGYIFTNSTKTATNWGINIRITIQKGTATDTVIINGFGGAFD